MKPDLEAWKQLYDLAAQIRNLQPWKIIDFDNMIGIKIKRKTYYCSVTGKEKTSPSVAVYEGKKGMADLMTLLVEMDEGWDPAYLAGDQNCIICYYGDREDVLPDQMDIIHAVKPGFRGKGKWIYFDSCRARYYPSTPDNKQVRNLIPIFEGLLYGLKQLKNEQPDWVDEFLLVSYDSEENGWKTAVRKVPEVNSRYPAIGINNTDLLDEIMNCSRTDEEWYVNLNYLFIPVEYGKDVINPLIFIIFNINEEMPECMSPVHPEESEQETVMNNVIDLILKNGIPKSIVTTCPSVYYALDYFCCMMDIDLMVDTDHYVDKLMGEIAESLPWDDQEVPDFSLMN